MDIAKTADDMGVSNTDHKLPSLVASVRSGEIQLVEFQREWSWTSRKVAMLLHSIAIGYPLSSILLLNVGDATEYACRPFIGVEAKPRTPHALVLDGQQRLTACSSALGGTGAVPEKKSFRRYFFDMRSAVADSRDADAMVFSIACEADGKMKAKAARHPDGHDLRKPEGQFEAFAFPANLMFDCQQWIADFRTHHKEIGTDPEVYLDAVSSFENRIIGSFKRCQVKTESLPSDMPPFDVSQIYERRNSGGETLQVFDLVISRYAPAGIDLRREFSGEEGSISGRIKPHLEKVLDCVKPKYFADAVMMTRNLSSPGSKRILAFIDLPATEFLSWQDRTIEGYELAAEFLREIHYCEPIAQPLDKHLFLLAGLFASLEDCNRRSAIVRDRIRRWFWHSLLIKERFDMKGSMRIAAELVNWIDRGGSEPVSYSTKQLRRSALLRTHSKVDAALGAEHHLLISSTISRLKAERAIHPSLYEGTGGPKLVNVYTQYTDDTLCNTIVVSADLANAAMAEDMPIVDYLEKEALAGSAPYTRDDVVRFVFAQGISLASYRTQSPAVNLEKRSDAVLLLANQQLPYRIFDDSALAADDADHDAQDDAIEGADEVTVPSISAAEAVDEGADAWGGRVTLLTEVRGARSYLRDSGGHLTALANSLVPADGIGSLAPDLIDFRMSVIGSDRVRLQPDGRYLLLEDIPVKNFSYASALLKGINQGRKGWKRIPEMEVPIAA